MTNRDPIHTEFVDTPTNRRLDWAAYRDPDGMSRAQARGTLIGRGDSREAAIADLLRQEAKPDCHLVDGKYCSVYADNGILMPCPNRCTTVPAIGPVPIPVTIKPAVPAFDKE